MLTGSLSWFAESPCLVTCGGREVQVREGRSKHDQYPQHGIGADTALRRMTPTAVKSEVRERGMYSSVQVGTGMYNAYTDREVGARATFSSAWNPGISLGLLAVSYCTRRAYASLKFDSCPRVSHLLGTHVVVYPDEFQCFDLPPPACAHAIGSRPRNS